MPTVLGGTERASQQCMWQEECGSLGNDICSCSCRPAASILGVMVNLCIYLGECQVKSNQISVNFNKRLPVEMPSGGFHLETRGYSWSDVGRFHRVGDSSPGQCVDESIPCKALKKSAT